jgi:stage III sporulation protein AG
VILHKKYPEVIGVVVVIKNCSDVKLRVDVIQMVSTLLGILPEKVAVFSSK